MKEEKTHYTLVFLLFGPSLKYVISKYLIKKKKSNDQKKN